MRFLEETSTLPRGFLSHGRNIEASQKRGASKEGGQRGPGEKAIAREARAAGEGGKGAARLSNCFFAVQSCGGGQKGKGRQINQRKVHILKN